jgi:hypothetical protein
MAEGTIKRLMDRGFGFIDTGGSKDLFFRRGRDGPFGPPPAQIPASGTTALGSYLG